MSFLQKGYQIPKQESGYMKLEEGDNTFRVLSSAITGWEWWIDDPKNKEKRKPLRVKDQAEIPDNALRADPKHFWAFAVWNVEEERVQILELTQRTIMTAIERLVRNEKWGDPKEYDITVFRSGKELNDTNYTVTPNPKEKLDPGIVKMYKDMKIDLEALYRGDDPFASRAGEEVSADEVPEDLGE